MKTCKYIKLTRRADIQMRKRKDSNITTENYQTAVITNERGSNKDTQNNQKVNKIQNEYSAINNNLESD